MSSRGPCVKVVQNLKKIKNSGVLCEEKCQNCPIWGLWVKICSKFSESVSVHWIPPPPKKKGYF